MAVKDFPRGSCEDFLQADAIARIAKPTPREKHTSGARRRIFFLGAAGRIPHSHGKEKTHTHPRARKRCFSQAQLKGIGLAAAERIL